jgi:hypothetical protein
VITLEDRIAATERALLAACRDAGAFVSGDGRVSEATAARLLGIAPGTLRNKRSDSDNAPPCYRRPLAGCSYSYRVAELAAWIEGGREYFHSR